MGSLLGKTEDHKIYDKIELISNGIVTERSCQRLESLYDCKYLNKLTISHSKTDF